MSNSTISPFRKIFLWLIIVDKLNKYYELLICKVQNEQKYFNIYEIEIVISLKALIFITRFEQSP